MASGENLRASSLADDRQGEDKKGQYDCDQQRKSIWKLKRNRGTELMVGEGGGGPSISPMEGKRGHATKDSCLRQEKKRRRIVTYFLRIKFMGGPRNWQMQKKRSTPQRRSSRDPLQGR